jgi:ornithine cyclodeaminase/alanine dehydrogenase-like protein (mu-crystallin family)
MSQELLYLSRTDVEKVALPMAEMIVAMEAVFRDKGEGRTEMPPKFGIHPAPEAYLNAMPARVASAGAVGIKWVSIFAENLGRGLPAISGLVILNDPENGLPLAVMDCIWLTAKRTAAASAVAAKYLARKDAESLAIIGCGAQGRSHLEAMLVQFPGLRRVLAYDRVSATLACYAAEMHAAFGVEVVAAPDTESAVREADIIVTAAGTLKKPTPVIQAEWIKPSAFCMPVDYDCLFTSEAIQAMDLFYTDDVAQMEYYRTIGYFRTTPAVHGDLGEVVTGKKPGRTRPDQQTMAMHLGIAIEDVVTAQRIYRKAVAEGIGTRLPL